MGKIDKLEKIIRDKEIVKAALSGTRVADIAKDEELTEATVNKVIKEALESALYHFEQDAKSLLAKNYMRLDIIIETLMTKALSGEYPAIDRVDKLINTQAKLLQHDPSSSKNKDGGVNIFSQQVFTTVSPEFKRLFELANDDPHYMMTVERIEEQDVN